MEPPVAEKPANQLLQQIEFDFNRGNDAVATQRIQQLAFEVLLEWEAASGVFRAGLERINWWETLFERTLPMTYERLKRSAGRRANAAALLNSPTKHGVWRGLLIWLRDSERKDAGIWQAPEGGAAQCAINVADEFGIDRLHFVIHRGQGEIPLIRAMDLGGSGDRGHSFELPSEALWDHNALAAAAAAANRELSLVPVQLWTVPFQDAVVVLLQSTREEQGLELVWIRTVQERKLNRDPALWALNRNTQLEDAGEFVAPPFLQGDPTLTSAPLVAACEGRVDILGVQTACAAVSMRRSETLVFDQVKQDEAMQLPPKHWRQLLTQELWERSGSVITASCYVLDALLLYACEDGVLRAHPRGNPQSTYHVRDMQTRVYQMTSLYNVVAIIHSAHILEVWHVSKKTDDPFLQFGDVPLYRTTNADADHAPLLHGPYVLFRGMDGVWVRVQYEQPASAAGAGALQAKQLVKVPFHAGWSIVSVKNASWRHTTLVLRNPQTKRVEDFFLISSATTAAGAGGEGASSLPFLLAPICAECGAKATHLCGACLSVGFCVAHGEQNAHGRGEGCGAGVE